MKRSRAEDDAEDFAKAMESLAKVRPITADPRGRVHASLREPLAPLAAPAGKPRNSSRGISAPAGKPGAAQSDLEEDAASSFAAPGVDRRELRKLRRGNYPPVRLLDLHGFTGAEAVAKVSRFIEASRTTCRSIAIVHGRGLHSKDNIAVLKTRVRACLRQHPGVLAFSDAPQGHGGPGAVFVLLRKN